VPGPRPGGFVSVLRFSGRALGAYSDDQSERIDVCHRARTYRQDPRMPLPRHDAGDGVQTVSECRQALASVTGRALSAGGHERHRLQGWPTGRTRRRVRSPYTTLDNNSILNSVHSSCSNPHNGPVGVQARLQTIAFLPLVRRDAWKSALCGGEPSLTRPEATSVEPFHHDLYACAATRWQGRT